MSQKERIRETLDRPLTQEYLQRKLDHGWKPVAIEWERAGDASEGVLSEVPYGMKVGTDCHHLVEDENEMAALRLILSQVVRDRPLSEVAAELNRRGFRRRDGKKWTQGPVFEMLPRVIEVAPSIYASESWQQERVLLEEATA